MKKSKPPSKPLADAGAPAEHDWWGMLRLEAWSFLGIDIDDLRQYIASGAKLQEEERLQLHSEMEDALSAYQRGEHALAIKTVESTARACRFAQVVSLARSGLRHGKVAAQGRAAAAKRRREEAQEWHAVAIRTATELRAQGRAEHELAGIIAQREGMPSAKSIRPIIRKRSST